MKVPSDENGNVTDRPEGPESSSVEAYVKREIRAIDDQIGKLADRIARKESDIKQLWTVLRAHGHPDTLARIAELSALNEGTDAVIDEMRNRVDALKEKSQ